MENNLSTMVVGATFLSIAELGTRTLVLDCGFKRKDDEKLKLLALLVFRNVGELLLFDYDSKQMANDPEYKTSDERFYVALTGITYMFVSYGTVSWMTRKNYFGLVATHFLAAIVFSQFRNA